MRSAATSTHSFFEAYLAARMPSVPTSQNMSRLVQESEYHELCAAATQLCPENAMAPRAVSVTLLVHKSRHRAAALSTSLIQMLVDAFVHVTANMSESVRGCIMAGENAVQYAALERQSDNFIHPKDANNDGLSHVVSLLVKYVRYDSTTQAYTGLTTCQPIPLSEMMTRGYVHSHPFVTVNGTRVPSSEMLRDKLFGQLATIDPQMECLHLASVKHAILRALPSQPPYAYAYYLAKFSSEFYEHITPWTYVDTSCVNKTLLSNPEKEFRATNHFFKAIPAQAAMRMFSRRSSPHHHDGKYEMLRLIKENMFDEMIPLQGIALCKRNTKEVPQAARKLFETEDFVNMNEWGMEESMCMPHVCGMMLKTVDVGRYISAYAPHANRLPIQHSSIAVTHPIILPLNRQFWEAWFILPVPDKTFFPYDRSFLPFYQDMMSKVMTAAAAFVSDPFAFACIARDVTQFCTSEQTPGVSTSHGHVNAIDASLEFFTANSDYSTCSAACDHFASQAGDTAPAGFRFMAMLTRLYGPSMPINEALLKLCDAVEAMAIYGITARDIENYKALSTRNI